MSIIVDRLHCSTETLQIMDKDLNITIKPPQTNKNNKNSKNNKVIYLSPFRVQLNLIFIPFSYGIKKFNYKPITSRINHKTSVDSFKFIGELREEQKIVRNEAIELLNKQYSCVISTHVGFGKSILATYFMCKIQLKTLIIVNRLVLIDQWIEVLKRFIENPTIHVIKPNQVIDWDCNFFIINAINLPKIGYTPEIGLVVVDELHLIVSKVISSCFQYLSPNYMIGLSATPYRPDGLDVLIDLYFGEERIDRQLYREHHVFVKETNFTPIINLTNHYSGNNKIDWNDILNQQSMDIERNELIINCILDNFKEKNRNGILVLCKRVEQIKLLYNKLISVSTGSTGPTGFIVECLYGDKQPNMKVKEKIVLIGTIQKVGTGFDAPYLDTLIIAADVEEYFIQYLGRVFRKLDIIPYIYDFIDNNNILKKHFKTRQKTYIKHGGIIKKVN